MNYKQTTALKKIRQLKNRIKVIQGGSSAGKTIAILILLIDKCIRFPGTEVSIVSESIPHLRRGCLKDFLKIMKDTNRYQMNNYNKTLLRYDFSNSSYIEFFSADSEEKLRGGRRQILYINECNSIDYESYLQLAIRTSGEIYLDYNPSQKFWINTEVIGQEDTDFIILTYKDNESLSKDVVKMLELNREKAKTSTYWENWCNVYLDGLTGQIEGNVYNDYQIIDVVPDEAKLLGYGLDFGYSVDPLALIGLYKYNDTIIADEIIYQKGLLNSELSLQMKQLGIKEEIYADSAEPKSIQEIKKYGFNIKPVEKGRDSINYGIQIIQQQKLYITRRSVNLLEELQKYMWKKSRDGGYTNDPIDSWNHGLDALRYICMMKLGQRQEASRAPFIKFL